MHYYRSHGMRHVKKNICSNAFPYSYLLMWQLLHIMWQIRSGLKLTVIIPMNSLESQQDVAVKRWLRSGKTQARTSLQSRSLLGEPGPGAHLQPNQLHRALVMIKWSGKDLICHT